MARHFELVAKKGPVSDSNESQRVADGWVNISRLKKWASIHLTAAPYLRSLILSERDELSIEEFLVKVDIWVKLLAEETSPITTRAHVRRKAPNFTVTRYDHPRKFRRFFRKPTDIKQKPNF